MEVTVPQKTFRFDAADNVLLTALAQRMNLTQTDAVKWAIRHTMKTLENGQPVYMGDDTSATPGRGAPPLRVVEKQHAGRGKPPAKARPNSKRGAK
jgi:hypothetical protein